MQDLAPNAGLPERWSAPNAGHRWPRGSSILEGDSNVGLHRWFPGRGGRIMIVFSGRANFTQFVTRIIAGSSVAVIAAGCGGHNHLADYNFASRSIAVVYVAPPRPELLTGWYSLPNADDPVSAVVAAGSGVAKEVVGRKARSRLDSATRMVNIDSLMSTRTLERVSRYLGAVPSPNRSSADFLLEVNMHNSGIDIRGQHAAYLFMSATAVLLDARSGREIWSFDVDGRNRLTPFLYGGNRMPTGAITASVLNTVSIEDFQRALEQLADFSSNEITDRLRDALRDVRR